ncbi:ABC-type transport system, involved in lipoprotein release, permease component [Desulfitobacterium dichloroeliminans LMG P-21439]|uniref:ABC-type transport system, involved in lipoprotein release, permease component n=1 Tax=Desulfitobacterium dichloroeliminans (strain LMG P-21439 / DCA1) TaxID=871963 RepID=L0F4D5_DESDL|nr:FtsX-like permease family protein [Desulfitobacterium dichloroeliminans]AGA67915.1 ABC-type transport system, involved in lipoprotein release, permease component [Desulfitobacterium dichloroeliminans LMG P-21439]
MNWLIIKNDFLRNKIINLTLLLFMMFSACLAVLSVVMAVQTFTAISELYATAQPPHFLQMHKGEIQQEEITEFMSGYEGLTDGQVVTMVNVYGESLTIVGREGTYDLADCRLDIGLVKQNEAKDLLLNAEHEKVSLAKGEVGMPILLKGMYGMEIGDQVILSSNNITQKFVIAEFVLDAQMNSTMTSSTRILLNDEDFAGLEGQIGENEYLIEGYFSDTKEAANFQTAYENAGLPQNGQAVTYTIIFMLSALTDIVTVFVLLLVSLLLILVAFICVRYTIMAALEEDIGEIGTMKAIGLSFSNIRDLYLHKYRALAVVGVSAGTILAFVLSGIFTKHISTTFGNVRLSLFTILLALVVGGLVFLLINVYCARVLKKIKKVTVVDALVRGKGFENEQGGSKDGLHRAKRLPINWQLSLREVFYHFKQWVIVFAVVMIAFMMMMVPVNLLNTFEAPEFITYMGSSLEDILIEVENGEKLESNYARVKQVLVNDATVKNYYEYGRVRVQTTDADGELMNLHIDRGDNSGNELKYLQGRAPEGEKEIAISYLNASKIGKDAGETMVLSFIDKQQEFVISGVYQDVTSGGFTAKSHFDFLGVPAEKYTFSVHLQDPEQVEAKAQEWSGILGTGVTVDPMEEFIDQTLGGVSRQLRTIVLATVLMGACLAMLIIVLFLKLRLAKDGSAIAILKALGFSERDIRVQYLIKIGAVSLIGILAGILFTDILGEKIVNAALSLAGLGIKQVELMNNPIIEYILCPWGLLALILLVTWIVLGSIRKYTIVKYINE